MSEYDKLIIKYNDINDSIKELNEEKDFIKSQLKVLMERDAINVYNSDIGEITLNTRRTTSVDKNLGVELFGERFNEVMRTTTYDIITIKRK